MTSHPRPDTPLSLTMAETGETFLFRRSARGDSGSFAFQWRLAVGKVGPGPHDHAFEDETFHVVAGRLQIFMEGRCHELGPGDSLVVPAGVKHHFGHPGGEETVVEVGLSGHRMEDQFIPLATRFGSPARMPMSALPQMIVQFNQGIRDGASIPHPRFVGAIFGVVASFFRLFGIRPLAPIVGWESRSAA
jgi:quercetin dioxygenase-like cupin family protein